MALFISLGFEEDKCFLRLLISIFVPCRWTAVLLSDKNLFLYGTKDSSTPESFVSIDSADIKCHEKKPKSFVILCASHKNKKYEVVS